MEETVDGVTTTYGYDSNGNRTHAKTGVGTQFLLI
jgi:YD repeat-containing protein